MAITHPLESVFDMEQGSFSIDDRQEMIEVPAATLPAPVYEDDNEDEEISGQIAEVYDAAMKAYENQTELFEIVEPRYAARTAEVANQILKTALDAVALRSKVKIEKRKVGQGMPFGGTNISGGNNIIADRNTILDMISERKKQETFTIKEIK